MSLLRRNSSLPSRLDIRAQVGRKDSRMLTTVEREYRWWCRPAQSGKVQAVQRGITQRKPIAAFTTFGA